MLKVKTRIGTSKIHGTGLFADEFIPKGTITWQYNPQFDISISTNDMDSLNSVNRDYYKYYCYFDKKRDVFILCSDNQRFINHTEDKSQENILSTPDQDVSLRDISIGEELLCDYNKFDSEYFERMNIGKDKLL